MADVKIKKIKALRITTGYDCDCKCSYCTQLNSDISHRFNGSGSQLQSLCVILKNRQILSDNVLIEIEGGEPLLHIDMIKQIVTLCDQLSDYNIHVSYIIVSNCHKLNTKEGRELITWMKNHGCKFVVSASFDHDQKNPRYLTDDTYTFLRNLGLYSVNCTYVVKGKEFINRAKQNIDFLNDKGFAVSILWNFFAYDELADESTREQYQRLVLSTKNNSDKQRFSGSPDYCRWVGISPNGRLYGCNEANFGIADLEKGKKMSEEKCNKCDLKEYCKQCIVRKSLYGDSLCHHVRANYRFWEGGV